MNKPTFFVKLLLFAGLSCALYAGVLTYRAARRDAAPKDLKDVVAALPAPAAHLMPPPVPKVMPRAEEAIAETAAPAKKTIVPTSLPAVTAPALKRIAVAAIASTAHARAARCRRVRLSSARDRGWAQALQRPEAPRTCPRR